MGGWQTDAAGDVKVRLAVGARRSPRAREFVPRRPRSDCLGQVGDLHRTAVIRGGGRRVMAAARVGRPISRRFYSLLSSDFLL